MQGTAGMLSRASPGIPQMWGRRHDFTRPWARLSGETHAKCSIQTCCQKLKRQLEWYPTKQCPFVQTLTHQRQVPKPRRSEGAYSLYDMLPSAYDVYT